MVAITAAGVSAAANVLGGLGGFIGGSRANKLSRAQFRESKRQFDVTRQDALNAIPNRVKDATAAGIHPLFAMGMNAPTSGNPIIAGDPNAGSDAIGSAARGIARAAAVAEEAAIRKATIKSIEARTAADEAEAMYIRSKTAEVMHGIAATGFGRRAGYSSPDVNPDGSTTVPSEVVAANPDNSGLAAGTRPGFVKIKTPNGLVLNVPNSDYLEPGELLGPAIMGVDSAYGAIRRRVQGNKQRPARGYRPRDRSRGYRKRGTGERAYQRRRRITF